MSSIDYKIPKIEVKAYILVDQDGGNPEEYILYLNEFSRYRKGQETLFEFLNKDKSFIPLKHSDSGEFIALNIDRIIYLEEQMEATEVMASKKQVLIDLVKNINMEVGHFRPLPDSQSRVQDYLNGNNQFIVFFHNNRKIFFNKHKIIKVKELDS
ncbi:MAG: hypothetical protein GY757_57165 [bacterium]|nr:hypothetical protein [bacterium]